MSRKITLPTAPSADVVLTDGDVDRVYRLVPVTRSVKSAALQIVKDREALDVEKDGYQEAWMRLICDELNLLAKSNSDDAPLAGDLLFLGWMDERVTDDQILVLREQLIEASADPN